MKNVGIIICNYNKKEFVVGCIESLRRQTIKDFDVYVVDNASTDGSAEYLKSKFGDEIQLICNIENLGGSGGFNTGIKEAIKGNFEFMMLLDNDVILSEDCVENCLSIMNHYDDIGMLGCEILKMDYPDRIQEFGPTINYDTMNFELNHGGEIDNGQLPDLFDCDYVPACAMMIRKEVVEAIGLMPQENFIYYDDITWGVRCHRAGYRVVVTSLAKAWHKGGAAINPTTFASYYLNRNKIRFFMRYMATVYDDSLMTEWQIEERAENIIKDVFEGIYSCNRNGMPNMSKTRMDAFLDAIWGVTGKADAYKIRERELPDNKLEIYVLKGRKILLHMNGLWESTRRLVNWLYELEKKKDVQFEITVCDEKEYIGQKILGISVISEQEADNIQEFFDVNLHICKHVYEIYIPNMDKKWVDGWRNAVLDEQDYLSQKAYESSYDLFRTCFSDILINKIKSELKRS